MGGFLSTCWGDNIGYNIDYRYNIVLFMVGWESSWINKGAGDYIGYYMDII